MTEIDSDFYNTAAMSNETGTNRINRRIVIFIGISFVRLCKMWSNMLHTVMHCSTVGE